MRPSAGLLGPCRAQDAPITVRPFQGGVESQSPLGNPPRPPCLPSSLPFPPWSISKSCADSESDLIPKMQQHYVLVKTRGCCKLTYVLMTGSHHHCSCP